MNARTLSRMLGCLGLGLGAMEMADPNGLAARLGLPRRPELMGWFGLRAAVTGLMVLMRPRAPSGPTLQAIGSAVDMAMLLPALSDRNPKQCGARQAFVLLAGMTALGALCAARLAVPPKPAPRPVPAPSPAPARRLGHRPAG